MRVWGSVLNASNVCWSRQAPTGQCDIDGLQIWSTNRLVKLKFSGAAWITSALLQNYTMIATTVQNIKPKQRHRCSHFKQFEIVRTTQISGKNLQIQQLIILENDLLCVHPSALWIRRSSQIALPEEGHRYHRAHPKTYVWRRSTSSTETYDTNEKIWSKRKSAYHKISKKYVPGRSKKNDHVYNRSRPTTDITCSLRLQEQEQNTRRSLRTERQYFYKNRVVSSCNALDNQTIEWHWHI